MLIKKKHIEERYDLTTRNDAYPKGVNYFDKILKRSLPEFIYLNKNMGDFLDRIEPLVANLFDMMNISKNWKRWYVDKYKNDHIR